MQHHHGYNSQNETNPYTNKGQHTTYIFMLMYACIYMRANKQLYEPQFVNIQSQRPDLSKFKKINQNRQNFKK